MAGALGLTNAALGFVVDDPDATARQVALQLKQRGFEATSIHGAEPGLPIPFVRTDALSGSALVFRKHVLRMGAKPDAWTPRTTLADRLRADCTRKPNATIRATGIPTAAIVPGAFHCRGLLA